MAPEPSETPETKADKLTALFKTMTENVYFQSPANTQMEYPCIRYKLDDLNTFYADDKPYRHNVRYQVTVIDYDPETPIFWSVADLPGCSFERAFTSDNLNHFVFNLFF